MSLGYLALVGDLMMQAITDLLGSIYIVILHWLALYVVVNLVNTILNLRIKNTFKREEQLPTPREWPLVTVQLPILNDKYTAERLLRSVARLDYPADCLQIQVVDDSTDDTTELDSQLVVEYEAKGRDIQWLHRTNSKQTPSLQERLRLIPLMTITGFSISLSTYIAVLQGLTGRGGRKFVRTLKLNSGNLLNEPEKVNRAYMEPISPMVWAEMALGIYTLLTGIRLAGYVGWEIIPWMLIYTAGYLYIAGLNLIQHTPNSFGGMTKSLAV